MNKQGIWKWVLLGLAILLIGAARECFHRRGRVDRTDLRRLGPAPRLDEFKRLPILFNGRKMPMDSYASNVLLQLSGRRTLNRRPAVEWLAWMFFNPEHAEALPVFLIEHPDTMQALGLEAHDRGRFSFEQLVPSLEALAQQAVQANQLEVEARGPVERELLRLYENVSYYLELYHTLDFARPNPDFAVHDPEVRQRLGLAEDQQEIRFLDIFFGAGGLREYVEGLDQIEPAAWTPQQQEAFRVSSALFGHVRRFSRLRVTLLPVDPHGQEVWMAPWDLLRIGITDTGMANALRRLGDMQQAWTAVDQKAFNEAARAYDEILKSRLFTDRAMARMDLEVRYNRLRLFSRASTAYTLAFFFAFAFFITGKPFAFRAGVVLVLLGLLPHISGMAMRMMIMGRPPVTNLYSTFLFVGCLVAIFGLLLEAMQRNGLGLLASSFGGLAMLFLANRFFSDGDTMGKLVAVLNSNFWLSTHVLAITTGYAGVVFAGLLGHVYLLQAIFGPGNRDRLSAIYRALFGMLGFGLIFSFLGTMLGGVWADQSWGRFWGWDPKENGALLIVLWCALLFHARIAGLIRNLGMAAGSVIGVVFVLMAWLGVNLLGVGLHSYGFITGLGGLFFATVAAELLFVGVATPLAARNLIEAPDNE